jgi:hypothetical protein
MKLTDKADVKLLIKRTDSAQDTLIDAIIDGISNDVEVFCNREFEEKARTERFDPNGSSVLFLPCTPITTLTSIKEDDLWVFGSDTVIDPSEYTFNAVTGRITFSRPLSTCPESVQVVYTGGYATNLSTLPKGFRLAVSEICAATYCMNYTSANAVPKEAESGMKSIQKWLETGWKKLEPYKVMPYGF